MTVKRLQNEGTKPFEAFELYCEMGDARSVAKVASRLRKSGSLIRRWSTNYQWQERVKAWDADNDARRLKAEDAALKKEAEIWARRQIELRERSWQRADKILQKAEEMLAHPLTKKTGSVDGKTVTINPVHWSYGDLARLIQVAEQAQRLCANLPTDKTEVTGPDNTPITFTSPINIYLPDNGRDKKP